MRVLLAFVCVALLCIVPALAQVQNVDNEIEHRVFAEWCTKNAASNLDSAKSKVKAKQEELNSAKAAVIAAENAFSKARDDISAHRRALSEFRSINDTRASKIHRLEFHRSAIKRAFHHQYDKINWENEISRIDSIIGSAAVLHDRGVRENVALTLKTYRRNIDHAKAKLVDIQSKVDVLEKERKNAADAFTALNAKTSVLESSRSFANTTYFTAKQSLKTVQDAFNALNTELDKNQRAYNTCVRQQILKPAPVPPAPKPTPAPTPKPVAKPDAKKDDKKDKKKDKKDDKKKDKKDDKKDDKKKDKKKF